MSIYEELLFGDNIISKLGLQVSESLQGAERANLWNYGNAQALLENQPKTDNSVTIEQVNINSGKIPVTVTTLNKNKDRLANAYSKQLLKTAVKTLEETLFTAKNEYGEMYDDWKGLGTETTTSLDGTIGEALDQATSLADDDTENEYTIVISKKLHRELYEELENERNRKVLLNPNAYQEYNGYRLLVTEFLPENEFRLVKPNKAFIAVSDEEIDLFVSGKMASNDRIAVRYEVFYEIVDFGSGYTYVLENSNVNYNMVDTFPDETFRTTIYNRLGYYEPHDVFPETLTQDDLDMITDITMYGDSENPISIDLQGLEVLSQLGYLYIYDYNISSENVKLPVNMTNVYITRATINSLECNNTLNTLALYNSNLNNLLVNDNLVEYHVTETTVTNDVALSGNNIEIFYNTYSNINYSVLPTKETVTEFSGPHNFGWLPTPTEIAYVYNGRKTSKDDYSYDLLNASFDPSSETNFDITKYNNLHSLELEGFRFENVTNNIVSGGFMKLVDCEFYDPYGRNPVNLEVTGYYYNEWSTLDGTFDLKCNRTDIGPMNNSLPNLTAEVEYLSLYISNYKFQLPTVDTFSGKNFTIEENSNEGVLSQPYTNKLRITSTDYINVNADSYSIDHSQWDYIEPTFDGSEFVDTDNYYTEDASIVYTKNDGSLFTNYQVGNEFIYSVRNGSKKQ